MFKNSIVWHVVCLACMPCMAQKVAGQADPRVNVQISESDGTFTYVYTVSNPILSSGPVNGFFFDVATGPGDVDVALTPPDGWAGIYTATDPNLQVAFLAGNGIDCPDANAATIAVGSEAQFTIKSSYGPGEQDYFAAKFVPDPIFICDIEGDVWEGKLQAPTVAPQLPCDFGGDGVCDLADIDSLGAAIAAGNNEAEFDLTGDGNVSLDDLTAFLQDPNVNKLNGDADFSGSVGFSDFLTLSSNFGSEDLLWSQGNFIPSKSIDFADFLALSNNFGVTVAAAVPEPRTGTMLSLASLALLWLGRKPNS